MKRQVTKPLAVLASVGMLVGVFAAVPAEAKKRKKKPCPAYQPTEWGAEQPVTVVTDAATEEAPVVLEIETEAGLGTSSPESPDAGGPAGTPNPVSHAFANVQVDPKAKTTGLYARLSYTPTWDYDLYVRDDAGQGVAYSAGFNGNVPLLDGTGSGGHTGDGTENIDGLTSADCTGYLFDIIGATTPGETVTLELWLGEAAYTPES
ncbi:MAG TPA: hypothetical protein VFS18_05295 [Actinomycetota bacterium]|nr:hypothetical protein [Actinomycetota bacterium]